MATKEQWREVRRLLEKQSRKGLINGYYYECGAYCAVGALAPEEAIEHQKVFGSCSVARLASYANRPSVRKFFDALKATGLTVEELQRLQNVNDKTPPCDVSILSESPFERLDRVLRYVAEQIEEAEG